MSDKLLGTSDQVTIKLLGPCAPLLLLQSRRDEIFIDNVTLNDFLSPFMGGTTAMSLLKELPSPPINISSLRDFKTVLVSVDT
jgi:hypothetical protein